MKNSVIFRDMENILDNGSADATLSGWVEDSAVDPRL